MLIQERKRFSVKIKGEPSAKGNNVMLNFLQYFHTIKRKEKHAEPSFLCMRADSENNTNHIQPNNSFLLDLHCWFF